jgi:hypothetical protein
MVGKEAAIKNQTITPHNISHHNGDSSVTQGSDLAVHLQNSRNSTNENRTKRKQLCPTPTIKIGREVFAASSSRFAVFSFGRKVEGVKTLFS